MHSEVRVGLVDGDEAIREGRRIALVASGTASVVFESNSAADVLTRIADHLIDVLIVDQRVQGMPGVELVAKLSKLKAAEGFNTAIVMTAPFANPKLQLSALRAGAHDLISQQDGSSSLFAAIRRIASGEVVVDLPRLRELWQSSMVEVLYDRTLIARIEEYSSRDREFIRAVVSGESIATVAGRYKISAYKVRKPVEALLGELNLQTLEQLQLRFLDAGLLDQN